MFWDTRGGPACVGESLFWRSIERQWDLCFSYLRCFGRIPRRSRTGMKGESAHNEGRKQQQCRSMGRALSPFTFSFLGLEGITLINQISAVYS